MKTKMKINILIPHILVALFVFALNAELFAQENKPGGLKDFKIVIEKLGKRIRMTCENGCAWKELTFATNKSQTIDEHGMTSPDKNTSDKDPGSNLADFLIGITKTGKGIRLKGIEGTAWIDLAFTLSKNQRHAIDEKGMANLVGN